jgi:hypothetical protein
MDRNFARADRAMSRGARIAVAFLARGAGEDWKAECTRFLDSYVNHPAGVEHSFYVLFKGFPDRASLHEAQALFERVEHRSMLLDDDKFDIGAYIEWINRIDDEIVCAFNTTSEILTDHWLKKLAVNLALPNAGLVGATASFESLKSWHDGFPPFPNVHVRSNAFMVDRQILCRYTEGMEIRDKLDAFRFESGPKSLSAHIASLGKEVMIVGRNGRGYAPMFWPSSETFRLASQSNLLVGDNQTRNFMALPWLEKRDIVIRTWGRFVRDFEVRT